MTDPVQNQRLAWARSPLLATLLVLIALAWWPGLTLLAQEQIDAGLKRALVTFGLARGLNAIISVMQGTSIAVQPFGLGINLTLGQVLEPVNQLVEQFSSLMLLASVAFATEGALLAIGAWWPVSMALTIVAIAYCGWWLRKQRPPRALCTALAVLLLVRFAVPFVAIGSDYVFRHFLEARYASGVRALQESHDIVQREGPPTVPTQAPRSIADRLKDAIGAPVAEVKQRYEVVRSTAETAVERIIDLIVIFALQTLVIPLLLLWALMRSSRLLLSPASRVPESAA